MKRNNAPQQTHFIGVLLPEDITLTLEDCRRYMNEAYGCKSGHGTPIHVTLVPPFRLPEDYTTDDLISAIEKEVLPQGLGFTAHIDNFDAFGDRTLFANVIADENWTKLRDKTIQAIINACPGCTKKDKKPFQPHATVANRDIPTGVMTKAIQVMNELNLAENFPVDNITIFERKGNRWEAGITLEIPMY
ncbi:2'-5' RNA ligase family protein [Treponema sp. OMZ 305]|uniref:2'-5' RNA ligase family protein n=1 Tax=Treponema sp. OMZ 305 TaxID=1659192 RepID=UPI0020A563E7|nr:2'-5' RNA ligase family protein [Treponema sp. OMZ 305]UTC57186.1 2'-5' RNA ligase family protein [Treponema sp. OMZ 305]